jgi:hypothetical protein
MNIDPDALLTLLFQTHAQCTMTKPVTFNFVKGKTNLLKDEIFNDKFDDIFQESYDDFLSLKLLRGSVHINPKFWFDIFKAFFYEAQVIKDFIKLKNENKQDDINEYKIGISNGCCTRGECSIKIFYEIINKHIQN